MQRPCPTCQRPADDQSTNPHRPFCSDRCQRLDLSRWLDGDYAIPAEPVPSQGHTPAPPPGDER